MTGAEESYDQLWEKFRKGSIESFELIYNQNAKILLSYGRKINSNREVVYDTVHELFSTLWERRAFIGPTVSVKNYLLKSLRTSLYKTSQQANKLNLEFLLYDHEEDFFGSRESEIIEVESNQTRKKLIKRAIVELSKREQEVLHLKFFENRTTSEIAEILEINYQSVKNTSSVAISKLRDFFESRKNQW
ncbi:MAG: sigma-70 family RNA polymerase sigma factor [Cyclobacteriaceae bacterium]